jgi:8-oxo-dGTP pyrophosphatase MutT (NUDIX family)
VPHIHEKIDFTVAVYVVHKNKVLLRLHDKYKVWCGVGGHIELNENPNQAAVREVKEEVGLSVVLVGRSARPGKKVEVFDELLPPSFMNIHFVSATHQHMDMIYFAKTKSNEVKPTGNDLSNEWRRLTQEDLEQNDLGLNEVVRFYALEALKEVNS